MAITFNIDNFAIDESVGLQANDTATPTGVDTTTLAYLQGLSAYSAGAMPTAQMAENTSFLSLNVPAGSTLTDISLAQDATGTAFSTSTGVDSGIQTVDGQEIYLFADATNANILVGRVGTSASSPAAFALYLEESSDHSSAGLFAIQFAPLNNPDASDPNDAITALANKIFVSANSTAPVIFSDFSGAPSGLNDWMILAPDQTADTSILVTAYSGGALSTVNVSTTGLGVGNQSVNPGDYLNIDFVTPSKAGDYAGKDEASLAYTAHNESITEAGFKLTQVTPSNSSTLVDLTIQAFNTTSDKTGTDYFTTTTATPVTITKVLVNGVDQHLSGTSVTLTNEPVNAQIEVFTSSSMDRLQITNVDSKDGFDVGAIQFIGVQRNSDHTEIGSHITFLDDGPTLSTTAATHSLLVDESGLPNGSDSLNPGQTTASTSYADAFTHSYGVDGAGSLAYALSTKGGASGLTETSSGLSVDLFQDGNDVIGKASNGDVVFRVSVDGTGQVTLAQYQAVVQPNGSDPNDTISLTSADLISLAATIKDGDKDSLSKSVNIATDLTFRDDGPSVTATKATDGALTVDESYLTSATNLGVGTDGSLVGLGTAAFTAAFAGLFSAAYGADGAGTSGGYTLGVNFNGATDHTGLFDTATHSEVQLSYDAGTNMVKGTVNGGADTVFTLGVDSSGNVTLTQLRAVDHLTASLGDTSEAAGISTAHMITLSHSVTDGDGDPAAAAMADIANAIKFLDDGSTMGAITAADNAGTFNVNFTAGQSNHGTIGGVDGADGALLKLVGVTDVSDASVLNSFTITQTGNHVDFVDNKDHTTWFTMDIKDGSEANGVGDTYDFEVLKQGFSTNESVNFKIAAGKPVETLDVQSVFGHASIHLDGLIFSGGQSMEGSSDVNTYFTNSLTKNVDDINPDNLGFGIMGTNPNQASQMNQNEGFVMHLGSPTDNIAFDVQGIGNNAKGVEVEYWLYNDSDADPLNGAASLGTLIEHKSVHYDVSSGNSLTQVLIDNVADFNTVFVRTWYSAADLQNGATQTKSALDNAGVRIQDFSIKNAVTIPNFDFKFDVQRADNDVASGTGDRSAVGSFSIHVSPDWHTV